MKQTKTITAVAKSRPAYPGRPSRLKSAKRRDEIAAKHRLFQKLEKYIYVHSELKGKELTTTAKIDISLGYGSAKAAPEVERREKPPKLKKKVTGRKKGKTIRELFFESCRMYESPENEKEEIQGPLIYSQCVQLLSQGFDMDDNYQDSWDKRKKS